NRRRCRWRSWQTRARSCRRRRPPPPPAPHPDTRLSPFVQEISCSRSFSLIVWSTETATEVPGGRNARHREDLWDYRVIADAGVSIWGRGAGPRRAGVSGFAHAECPDTATLAVAVQTWADAAPPRSTRLSRVTIGHERPRTAAGAATGAATADDRAG